MSVLLGLEYENELPPRVRDELEQLIAAIQTGFAQVSSTTTAFGQWQTIAQSAIVASCSGTMTISFAAGQAKYRYTTIGSTTHVAITIDGATLGGVASSTIYLQLPTLVGAMTVNTPCTIYDNGVWATGRLAAAANTKQLLIVREDAANWTIGAVNIYGSITYGN